MLSIFAGLFLLIASNHYSPPVDYEMTLAGNFGEPRPNHFHGGIDVKTDGVEGKTIYSIDDGYVCRITTGHYGFGNAVYVAHPNGYTSVYCHLRSFSPTIQQLLRRWQYKNATTNADIRLKATECPVARGQMIAISGNTGASTAPHLHLEVHDTRTWNMVDPLDFLASFVRDSLPPMAHAFMAYPVAGEGVFCGAGTKQSFPFSSHTLTRTFTAWGKIGLGIWANDYSEATYNHYGVKETILTVDGHEVFHSSVDNIPVQKNRMVNSWGDYDHYFRTGVWYMKSFLSPGIHLPLLATDENNGIIDIREEREYHICYTLRDIHGNTSTYSFIILGKQCDIPETRPEHRDNTTMIWNRTNMFSLPGMQLVIPSGNLPDNIRLNPTAKEPSEGSLSSTYSFYHRSFPLFGKAELSLAVRGGKPDPTKYYIVCRSDHNRFMGGNYANGWVTANISELGASYELEYDDRPPVINPFGQSSWDTGHVIRLALSDDKSGIKSFQGYIDNRFVIFDRNDRSNIVVCHLKDTPVKREGRMRHLRFVATDNRDNTSAFECDIRY